MQSEELKRHICIAAGVDCPQWLRQIHRTDLLEELRNLVSAGVLLIAPDGPELSPIISADVRRHYVPRAIEMIRMLKQQ